MNIVSIHQSPIEAAASTVGSLWSYWPARLEAWLELLLADKAEAVWPWSFRGPGGAREKAEAERVVDGAWRAFSAAVQTCAEPRELVDDTTYVTLRKFKRATFAVVRAYSQRLVDDGLWDLEDEGESVADRWLADRYATRTWSQWQYLRDQVQNRYRKESGFYRTTEYREQQRVRQTTDEFRAKRRARRAESKEETNLRQQLAYWTKELTEAKKPARALHAQARIDGVMLTLVALGTREDEELDRQEAAE
jgi:hypothetical protein